jgi:NADPH-dependent curcumin reductase
LQLLTINARVALCGTISDYNALETPTPIHFYSNLVARRARMAGFLVLDYLDRFTEGAAKLLEWVGDGRLTARDHIVDGLERAPEALNMLFTGANTGKVMVRVAGEEA